jgi:spore cortex formation protein SpoVR/YcgB (stage V sporulation)
LREANIQVARVDVKGKRSLTLLYTPTHRRELNDHDDTVKEMMKHVARLWGQFKLAVRLDVVINDETGETKQLHYWKPPK